MENKLIKVNPHDNVLVALADVKKGEIQKFEGTDYVALTDVQAKHKMAENDFEVGDPITMYGVLVGKAVQPIKKGEVLTTENVKHQSEKATKKNRRTWLDCSQC